MQGEAYKASLFSVFLAVLFSLFLVVDLDMGSGPNKARGLALVQRLFQSVLVDPLGKTGAVMLVLAVGLALAVYFWPKN